MKNYVNYFLLLEKNRIEQLKDKYSDKVPNNIIEYFYEEDPTSNKAYFEWLLKAYYNLDSVEKEQLEKLKAPIQKTFINFIKKYNKIKPKLSGEQSDINNYRRILQLYNVLQVDKEYSYSKKEMEKLGEVDILVNNYEWIIFTPYDYEVSEKYGHNNVKEGKNWCTCYDNQYFKEHFGPDGGMTYIINKLDETKDIALKKSKDGNIEVWDYKNENVYNYYVDRPNDFVDYLKKHVEDNEFLIDFFTNKPITYEQLPGVDLDTLRERWFEMNKDFVENYYSNYDYKEYVDWDSYEERLYNEMLEGDVLDEAINAMEDYIFKNIDFGAEELDEKEIENMASSSQLIEVLRNHDIWEDFLQSWFDKHISGRSTTVIDYFERLPDYEKSQYIDVDSYLEYISKDVDDEEIMSYY